MVTEDLAGGLLGQGQHSCEKRAWPCSIAGLVLSSPTYFRCLPRVRVLGYDPSCCDHICMEVTAALCLEPVRLHREGRCSLVMPMRISWLPADHFLSCSVPSCVKAQAYQEPMCRYARTAPGPDVLRVQWDTALVPQPSAL